MKIALVGPVYPYRGGIAHYTTMLYRALAEMGHEVLLVSFKRQYPGWLFPGRSDKDPSARRLLAEGADYLIDPFSPVTWIQAVRRLWGWKPDRLVLQWWTVFWAPTWFALGFVNRWFLHSCLVFVCHNVRSHERRFWDDTVGRLVLGWADEFIVQSESERLQLVDLLPAAVVRIVPHPRNDVFAVDVPSQAVARLRLELPPTGLVLLFFGIVREYKGLKYLLLALAQLRERLGAVFVVVAGEFWEPLSFYTELVAELGLESSVSFDDRYIPNEELPGYFSAADMLVAPYTRTTGSAVVQVAQGFGLPVVTTWQEEFSVPCAIAEPRNVNSLVDAIAELARSLPKHRGRVAAQHREGVGSWEDLAWAVAGAG